MFSFQLIEAHAKSEKQESEHKVLQINIIANIDDTENVNMNDEFECVVQTVVTVYDSNTGYSEDVAVEARGETCGDAGRALDIYLETVGSALAGAGIYCSWN